MQCILFDYSHENNVDGVVLTMKSQLVYSQIGCDFEVNQSVVTIQIRIGVLSNESNLAIHPYHGLYFGECSVEDVQEGGLSSIIDRVTSYATESRPFE